MQWHYPCTQYDKTRESKGVWTWEGSVVNRTRTRKADLITALIIEMAGIKQSDMV